MKIKLAIMLGTAVTLTCCKKNYTCECSNPGGVFKTYTLHHIKKKATDICDEHNADYQNKPMSESACRLK